MDSAIVGDKLERLVEISQRFGKQFKTVFDYAAVLIAIGEVGVESECGVEVRQSLLISAQLMLRRTAVAVTVRKMGVQFNGLNKSPSAFSGSPRPRKTVPRLF